MVGTVSARVFLIFLFLRNRVLLLLLLLLIVVKSLEFAFTHVPLASGV